MEASYFYMTEEELRICMAAIALNLVQNPIMPKEYENKLRSLLERLAEEVVK